MGLRGATSRPCPAGRWSMPGAVGQGSCKALLNCTAADVEAKLRYQIGNKGSEVDGEAFPF